MNKDLSKEYKEAVMNDLPDLWGRIEAAIDEEESKNGNETSSSNVINFVKEEDKTNTANKYAVNAFDNEPVKAQTQKKKFRIPAWVFVAVPSAAILLLLIIPAGFLMMSGGMGNKSYSTATMDMATATTTTNSVESATDGAFYDYAPAMDEPAIAEEAEEYVYSDSEPAVSENAATTTSDFTGTTEENHSKQETGSDYTLDLKNLQGDNYNFISPSVREEDTFIINDNVSVKFLSVHENDEGVRLAEVEIIEVLGDYDYTPDEFEGFEEGEIITAYMIPFFEEDELTDSEFNCIVRYIPDDEIGYVIEPANDD